MKLVYIHTLYMRRVFKSSKVSIDILVLVSIYVYTSVYIWGALTSVLLSYRHVQYVRCYFMINHVKDDTCRAGNMERI